MHYKRDKKQQKKEPNHVKQRTSSKKCSATLVGFSWNNNRAVHSASNCFSFKPKRLVWSYNNQISSTVTTRTWVLLVQWNRIKPSAGMASE